MDFPGGLVRNEVIGRGLVERREEVVGLVTHDDAEEDSDDDDGDMDIEPATKRVRV